MDQRPLRATKPRRRSNRMKKLRATNPGHVIADADAAKASIIGSGIKELSLPHVSPPPPPNVAQQAVWFGDSTNADINWWSPLGQYVLGPLSYAAMKGEPVPSAVHLYRSIEGRRDEAQRKGKEASDKSLLATSPPAIDSLPISSDKAHEAWCEVCKIDCSSKRSLNDHLLSKRHEKNLLKLNSEGIGPAITEPQGSHTLTSLDKSIIAPEVNPDQQVDIGPKSLETAVDDVTDNNHSLLAGSTQLPSASIDDKSASSPLELPVVTAPSPPVIDGCTALSVSIDIAHKAWCEVCKIDCCTKSVLDDHLLGKRHKKNLLKLQTEGIDPVIAEPHGPRTFNASDKPIIAIEGNPENQEADVCSKSLKSAVDDVSVSNHSLHATSTALPGSTDKPVTRQNETWCEVCKIGCSKKSDLDEHLLGKRHKKNLLKMTSESISPPSITAPSSAPMIAAAGSTSASSDNSNREIDGCSKSLKRSADDVSAEDMESKRGKVSSCGA